MSRCFAYPPPGYLPPSRGIKGSLIEESIKPQKEYYEKAKSLRKKERKREKKEKKRKREVISDWAVDGFGHGGKEKPTYDKTQMLEKQTESLKGKYTWSHKEDERSDVTEEHEWPIYLPRSSYLSENSQNSNKRGQFELPTANSHTSGSILRIRLSSLQKEEPGVNVCEDSQPVTSGSKDHLIGRHDSEVGQRLVEGQPNITSKSCAISLTDKQPSCTGANTPIPSPEGSGSKSLARKLSKVESFYETLIESWAPQSSEQGNDDTLDWLLQRKSQSKERTEVSSNIPCGVASNLGTRAQFLPSASVYALPYTVPL